MLINYDRKLKKPEYKLARVLAVHPDSHGLVRTVTVGYRRSGAKEKSLPYVVKQLEQMKIGVQRLAVVCPIEEQSLEHAGDGGSGNGEIAGATDVRDGDAMGLGKDVTVGRDDINDNDET